MAGLTEYYSRVLGVDPTQLKYIDDDLVGARLKNGRIYVLAFGDPVLPLGVEGKEARISIVGGRFHGAEARVRAPLALREAPLFRFSMIDVQQGDGMVMETPAGKIVLLDGGENEMFARHLAARYARTSAAKPLLLDGIIVSHGDADHFAGLTKIRESEEIENTPTQLRRTQKRLFAILDRLLHNGLVKRPGTFPDKTDRPETAMFGKTVQQGDDVFCTELVDDLMTVPPSELNMFFTRWVSALKHWNAQRAIRASRVSQLHQDAVKDLFNEPGLKVDVLGPIAVRRDSGDALKFLRAPRKSTELHLSDEPAVTTAFSASHTVNGHSIALRLHVGNVRFLFTGDLNQQAMSALRAAIPKADFECEILKAPHHGSHDFDFGMLKQAKPVVSLVSSGDESARTEHIHPRATLVSALGKVSRGETGVVVITELVAFFTLRGSARPADGKGAGDAEDEKPFFSFERTSFGAVHIRTDGKRVLVFTNSGKPEVKEAYAFSVDDSHKVEWHPNLSMKSAPA